MSNQALILKKKPTLRDFQVYMAKAVKARGFEKETLPEVFMLFLEECGEMAKAARKVQGIKTGGHSKELELHHEIADVFIYLLEICNLLGVNLEEAFRDKEKINSGHVWK